MNEDNHANIAELDWRTGVGSTIRWQLVCGLTTSGAVAALVGWTEGISLLLGVLAAIGNSYWLSCGVVRAAGLENQASEAALYRSAAARFGAMLGYLTLVSFFGAHLLYVAGGLLVAHLALFVFSALGLLRN